MTNLSTELERLSAVELARMFHDNYEELAPAFGYATRPETRQFDTESPNGRLMVATAERIITALKAAETPLPDVAGLVRWLGHQAGSKERDGKNGLAKKYRKAADLVTAQARQLAERDAEIARLREALERLARLGNGDKPGNSDGNMIARRALENGQ